MEVDAACGQNKVGETWRVCEDEDEKVRENCDPPVRGDREGGVGGGSEWATLGASSVRKAKITEGGCAGQRATSQCVGSGETVNKGAEKGNRYALTSPLEPECSSQGQGTIINAIYFWASTGTGQGYYGGTAWKWMASCSR